jgi:hypothetical protein
MKTKISKVFHSQHQREVILYASEEVTSTCAFFFLSLNIVTRKLNRERIMKQQKKRNECKITKYLH